MNRKKIVAGNWKMNLNYAEAMALADAVKESVTDDQQTHIILAPPFIYLHELVERVQPHTVVAIAAQNCADKNAGPYTGEVAASMLASVGVDYVIIGHSERRSYFREENPVLAEKINRSVENSLVPIFCCGETDESRKSGKHFDIVSQQLEACLFHLDKSRIRECVIAYEPVWAIGTGVNATALQVEEMHRCIRKTISEKYGVEVSGNISILYGGSVTPQNAAGLFSVPDVDGALVGGASLKAGDFISIINAMEKVATQ